MPPKPQDIKKPNKLKKGKANEEGKSTKPSTRVSERTSKGVPPPKYGFNDDLNQTPFVNNSNVQQNHLNSSYFQHDQALDLDESDFDDDTTLLPNGESTIIPNNNQVSVMKNMFQQFQSHMMTTLAARDTVIDREILSVKTGLEDKLDKLMNLFNGSENKNKSTVLSSEPTSKPSKPTSKPTEQTSKTSATLQPHHSQSNIENNDMLQQADNNSSSQPNQCTGTNNAVIPLSTCESHIEQQNIRDTIKPLDPSNPINVQFIQNHQVLSRQPQPNISNTPNNQFRKKIYDLPPFNGKPEDWPIFFTSFNETTYAYSYTNLDNSIRLRKSLSGAALESVQAMMIHPDNVPEILKELKFRFGRPEILVKSQIHSIRQIPLIKEDQIAELINFSTKMRNLVSFLQNADAEQYLQNPSLLEELINKLPLQRRLDWAEQLAKMNCLPSIADFTEWVCSKARVASLIETTQGDTTSRGKQPSNKRSMLANEVKNEPKCLYCQETHYINQCSKFMNITASQRWEWVKKSSVCFSCLRKGHRIEFCRNRRRCGVADCYAKHHSLLHEPAKIPNTSGTSDSTVTVMPSTSNIEKPVGVDASKSFNLLNKSYEKVYFRVVPVTLFGRKKQIDTFALLDEGSSMTIMETQLMNELDLNGKDTTLTMQWLNDGIATEDTKVVNCHIQGANVGCKKYLLKNVHAWKNLKLPCQSVNAKELMSLYPRLNGIPIQSFVDAKPRLLIGLDNAGLGVAKSWVDCSPSGPIAVQTSLGWILYGPSVSDSHFASSGHVCFAKSSYNEDLQNKYNEINELVQNYYELENFGVKIPEKPLQSKDIARANDILKNTTVFKGSYYETGLLWKKDGVQMPDNYSMALSRLQNLERKMIRDKQYADKYKQAMIDFVNKGYARKLLPSEALITTDKTWYLPHFGVVNINKPGKVRIVFDAAANYKAVSLNSQLLKGPDLNQPMLAVLSKFREKSIGVCADIQEMFCQVKIMPDDRQAQRFLWRNGNINQDVEIYEMSSMIFGATSSPTIAQYIKNYNAERFKDEFPEACQAIVSNHYVDDYVMSFDDEQDAINVSRQVKDIHKTANFNLRSFVSNSENVVQALENGSTYAKPLVNFNVESSVHNEKVLGMYWKSSTDEFVFDFKFNKVPEAVLNKSRAPTKREVLSMTMSLFDPFGFLANFHIHAKIILQTLWNTSIEWDDTLPEVFAAKWFEWQSRLDEIKRLHIPRSYFKSKEFTSAELHIFVDASLDAYAAVSYWRIVYANQVEVAFIFGKARVAPKKMLSVPRMELQAGVLGVRMKESILSCHTIKPSEIYFWSDSKTLLQWINSDSRTYKPFVAHRISEILESSSSLNWFWLPTQMNVADEATRTSFPVVFDSHSRWLNGPEILYDVLINIPPQPTDLCDEEIENEMRADRRKIMIVKSQPTMIVDLNRFSKYLRLKRVVAWCNRAVKLILAKLSTKCVANFHRGELSANELDAAELQLCRMVQKTIFYQEYMCLKSNSSIPSESQLTNLNPYIADDDLLRIQGRIDAATCVPLSTRRPIILPKNHQLTNLIISYYHELYLHANHETVICKLREKFWIPNIRQQLIKVRHKCQKCKIDHVKPKQPMMGPLPYDRVAAYVRPFTFTGLDYFGPVNVAIGRRREKRWVAVFTCLTVRAVHLELATDLSTDACILCLRNFFNIRGVPKRIRSDNGTNFIGINKELSNVPDFFDSGAIEREMSSLGVEWLFNSPKDPSAGGVWERMVQSVKRSLYATLRDRVPREDTLRSLLLEAANIINSRPLTYVPVSSEEQEPITPNHFLLGEINSTQTPGDVNEKLICLRKQWRISQQLKNHFYKRWIEEYLPVLTRRSKWFKKVIPLKIGDLVIICEVDLPRSKWIRGIIVEVYTGKDGQVRSAEVKTAQGIFRRPANKLAVLDVVKPEGSRGGECNKLNAPQPTRL